MKFDQLFIAGIDTYLPAPVSAKQMVAEGRYSAKEAAETQLESVLVAGEQSAPDMAVHAARGALARSGIDPETISIILHASVHFQGLEFYPTASYIHHAAVGDHSALALEVKGVSNGGLCSLELATAYLSAAPDRLAALVTTADNFSAPELDRWRAFTGMVMGDGASAMVLSRQDGFARLRSLATVSDPSFESLHRGREPFTTMPTSVDLHRRKADYLTDVRTEDRPQRFRRRLRTAIDRVLHDADTELAEIACFALPHIGRNLLEKEYFQELAIPESITTWRFGRCTGHMGAGDQIVGLSLLMDHGALGPGDRCMMIGVGAGFTWSCAVVEIQQRLPLRPCPLFT